MHQVWTDGACEPNPGKGGWGYTMKTDYGVVKEDCGGQLETTSNRMEMTAILEALKIVDTGEQVTVYSDSQYCVNGLTVWSAKWKKREWRKKGVDMPNRDLWIALEEQKARVLASFVWVRGHAGNIGNERADKLAEIGRAKALENAAIA